MALAISNKQHSKILYILFLGVTTGTLDAFAAIVTNPKVPASAIFKFIASGYFGKAAFAGGDSMELYGILFHYGFAFAFTILFFLLHPMFYSWFRNSFLTGVVYGIIIWAIMNLGVVPLSQIHTKPLALLSSLEACGILIVALGLPIAYIGTSFYFFKTKR